MVEGAKLDAIYRDWVEAEKVVAAARGVRKAVVYLADLWDALEAYDAYLAAEKAGAVEPSGLPERGLVSTGASVKGSRR